MLVPTVRPLVRIYKCIALKSEGLGHMYHCRRSASCGDLSTLIKAQPTPSPIHPGSLPAATLLDPGPATHADAASARANMPSRSSSSAGPGSSSSSADSVNSSGAGVKHVKVQTVGLADLNGSKQAAAGDTVLQQQLVQLQQQLAKVMFAEGGGILSQITPSSCSTGFCASYRPCL